ADLLVAGHRGREDGLAELESVGADGFAAEDRAVLESEKARHSCTTFPAAIVIRTAPWSVSPSSHELADRDRKPLSSTPRLAFRSSRTRFASAPTAIFGGPGPQ